MKIRFGEYELDEQRYLLECSGERVMLRPKVFDLLVYLVCHRTRVVRREELVERLWDTTSVGAGSLSGLVNELRQALAEDGRGPSSIRTVHARGYQFVAPVEEGVTRVEDPDVNLPDHTRRSRSTILIERVAEQGACGVVVENGAAGWEVHDGADSEPCGESTTLAALVSHAERAGFEIHRLSSLDESIASPSRFARQVIDSMIATRGREVALAAMPLPARVWLEESARQAVAGGLAANLGGPSDPLLSIGSLLSELSRRHPIMIVIADVGRAGRGFARDLVTLVRGLDQDPVLWVATTPALSDGGHWLRVLEMEGGFDRWAAPNADVSALDRSLRRLGLDPLPAVVVEAIEAHVQGDRVALGAIAEWLHENASPVSSSDRDYSDRAALERDVRYPSNSPRSPMRRVSPLPFTVRRLSNDS